MTKKGLFGAVTGGKTVPVGCIFVFLEKGGLIGKIFQKWEKIAIMGLIFGTKKM